MTVPADEATADRGLLEALRRHVGLKVVSDVRLDAAATRILFRSENAGADEQPQAVRIHPEDILRLAALAGRSEVVTDLRTQENGMGTLTLILRDNRGGTHWGSAVLIDAPAPRHEHQALAERARMADLGERALTLAHELRQPLFTISMANESLRLMLDRPDTTRSRLQTTASRIAEQVLRAQAIIKRTLGQAADEKIVARHTDVMEAAASAVEFLEALFERADIVVERDAAGLSACVALGRVELEQVFVNLLRNAADSIQSRRVAGWDGEGRIAITLEGKPGQIRCVVTDNGAGLSADLERLAFEPFFTTKAQDGTGLGLHICRQIVEKARGSIRLIANPGHGARVEISLSPASGGRATSDVVAA
ncbi:sensor histidine kinase [Novosphingobium sp. ZW T3_23]|uniref:sensor histidine kinase n=1 Tax=Novosphingobium sp. ZW T3_23 TaxID=3378084 RepID=UPI003851FE76